jgi:F0F1-type ATP synthase assembly protein I
MKVLPQLGEIPSQVMKEDDETWAEWFTAFSVTMGLVSSLVTIVLVGLMIGNFGAGVRVYPQNDFATLS